MNLLHHGHHHVPFEETDETLERRQLISRANDLASACEEKDRTIAQLRAEIARIEAKGNKRWRR